MKQTIKDTFQITKKDLKEFIRDRLRLITFFIMPIFMMIMVGFIFPNQNSLKNVPIGFSNQDKGKFAEQLIDVIGNLKIAKDNKAFILKQYNNQGLIKEAIKSQEINGGIYIPSDFSEKISDNKQVEIIIIEDQANPQISAITSQTLTRVVENFGKTISEQKLSTILVKVSHFDEMGKNFSPFAFLTPIKIVLAGIIEGNPNYFEFVAPGIIAMIVMTAVLTGLAASVSREKEQGTLDGILIAPIARLSIILGKAFAQAIRGMIQGIIVLLLAIFLFDVTLHGCVLLIFLILLLGVFSFVGLGILVSAIASEQETATQLLFMFQFPMLFLSGVFFPIQQMPKAMQYISKAIPLTYAIQALRKVMILGAGFSAIKLELLVLLIFGAATLLIAVPLFKKIITR